MRLAGLLRRVPILAWIIGGLAAAALIAWPLGGWDTVRVVSKEIPVFAEGDVFHGHRFDVTINGIDLRTHDTDGYEAKVGEIFVIVHATVTNVWHEAASASDLDDNIVLEDRRLDIPGISPTQLLAADGTTGPELNPGMVRDIDIVYRVPRAQVHAGETMRITLYDSIPREGFVLFGTSWVDLFVAGYAERTLQL